MTDDALRVRLFGLAARPELNEREGVVVSHDAAKGRFDLLRRREASGRVRVEEAHHQRTEPGPGRVQGCFQPTEGEELRELLGRRLSARRTKNRTAGKRRRQEEAEREQVPLDSTELSGAHLGRNPTRSDPGS